MDRLFKYLGLILALATLWAVSGYVIGFIIEMFIALFGVDVYPLRIILASINLIMGMLLFQGITRDPTAERIFFEGPVHEDESDIRVGCLWIIPASLLLYGVLWGIVIILLRILTK